LLSITQAEREVLEQELKVLRDLMNDKKEKAMLSLTPEERQSLDHLYQVAEEWKIQKGEVREQLEVYRRALAGSGFDFEKAMRYRELIDSEKTRLDKVNAVITELEAQIDALEGTS
jgi:Spy/CpxP family protein refolding chaperone